MRLKNEFDPIRDWAKERDLYSKGDEKTQLVKLIEECGELSRAILKDDKVEKVDALGDVFIVLVNLAYIAGYKLEDCANTAFNVIKDRKGKMNNGTFEKE